MEMPKTITGLIEFEIAKTKLENTTIHIKPNKKTKKLMKLTTKYLYKLMKLHYDQAKVRFDGTEFVINKNTLTHQYEDKGE